METTNAVNEFLGGPIFLTLAVAAVLIVGLLLRITFKSSNSEYKHDPKD